MRDPRMFGVIPPGQVFPTDVPLAPPGLTGPWEPEPAAPGKIPGRMYAGAALLGMGGHDQLAQMLLQKKRDELARASGGVQGPGAREELGRMLLMQKFGGV